MLNKKITLHSGGSITVSRGERQLYCPYQEDAKCSSWCPHFNIKPHFIATYGAYTPDKKPSSYEIVLDCTGTKIPVAKEELIRVGLI